MRYRYLQPLLGRWICRDRIRYVDGMNAYEYVRANPVKNFDPFGTECKCKLDGPLSIDIDRFNYDPVAGTIGLHFTITAKFKENKDYDPKACMYFQWLRAYLAQTVVTRTSKPIPV